jgi:hypothetical protein
MKDALILWGGVLFTALPIIIWGSIISWREHQNKKMAEQ